VPSQRFSSTASVRKKPDPDPTTPFLLSALRASGITLSGLTPSELFPAVAFRLTLLADVGIHTIFYLPCLPLLVLPAPPLPAALPFSYK